MPKSTYYVTVATGLIEQQQAMQDKANLTHEFAVEATDEEIAVLRDLLDKQATSEELTFKRATIPYKTADHDPSTERFNGDILNIYRYLYEIGTAETKSHIEKMGILPRLLSPDYHHAGYEEQKSKQ
ncbi:hypothetical protein SAMN03159341_105328 [Paenibacillus sp. 1_12]|uniref:hypothetical protein n=1 Tax=Paenibacillus sp. 1_12 TaxID=1566278 RepID=UPI0008F1D5A1|nr:hypothetical protein [Paenibacillus sp. 1_12]SFL37266.1 hypothetical protein SAMN03159341_105328 [Paenibacillus sp. 1_12]